MTASRWIIGEATGLIRTQPGRDAAFTRGGIDAYRVQAVRGLISDVRETAAMPDGWNDRTSAVHLARVQELADQLRQGGLWRRPPRGPLGAELLLADEPPDVAAFKRSEAEGRLLRVQILEQHPHQDGGWVARFSAVYAAAVPARPPAPRPVPIVAAPPVALPPAPAPPAVTAADPPGPSTKPPLPEVTVPPRGSTVDRGALPSGGDGCLPSLLPDPLGLGRLFGCLGGLGALLVRALLGGVAILVGTFLLSGLVWGILLPRLPGLVEALEPIRTRLPPVAGGVLGALVAAALYLIWRQRRR